MICTQCREGANLGKGGIENYETQHLPSKKCKKAAEDLTKLKKQQKKTILAL
ncbi:hypothetical protein B0H34DRAFT_722675 [Crassisporium funariophilum]|nr:hypothetical protein B0H34DRAFT_722675 [Crassisporium funariophilum]